MADEFEDVDEVLEAGPRVISLGQETAAAEAADSSLPPSAAPAGPRSVTWAVAEASAPQSEQPAPPTDEEAFPSLSGGPGSKMPASTPASTSAPAWPARTAAASASVTKTAATRPAASAKATEGTPTSSLSSKQEKKAEPARPVIKPSRTVETEREASHIADILVVDSAGFIRNAPLQQLAATIITLPDVIELEYNGNARLHDKPRKPRGPGSSDKPCRYGLACRRKHVCWYQHPESPEEAEAMAQATSHADRAAFGHDASTANTSAGATNETEAANAPVSVEEDEDDDGSGWIGPSNVDDVTKQLRSTLTVAKPDAKVACLTADYAMQNVMLQIGLNVVSVDGMYIKRVKSFVLYCTTCMTHTAKTMLQFCPSCGAATLIKASTSVDGDGNTTVVVPTLRKSQTRGLRYSIPMPKGGRTSNLILRADQPEMLKQQRKEKPVNMFSDEAAIGNNPFGKVHKVNVAKGGSINPQRKVVGYGKHNPNEKKPTRKGKRNK
ncbi:uncharacterized protein MONBRDRAFT_34185 [Monosiga brevicollis MX1]|uniref:Nin one binding (NOB1) Zn-ribbon-like domain-containing protein n=1 Tax=Monosiga brevicollis TaxID=81824 RepID=A9VA30_MONBE|nr:uncharacterized protein MONBRDRAFT_34185 [Monosiga brevicollis MX1]EDQ85656.1 predicted protein [Monosiga brevicollis MX1]|eukprot:XP_001749605.1 hypothetical protein [Monosiga brevicollis MX1]